MSIRSAWTMAVVFLLAGIAAGAGAMYVLAGLRGTAPGVPENASSVQKGRGNARATRDSDTAPPRLQPVEARAGDILGACNHLGAKSCEIRGFNVVYYYVSEANSYKDGHSDIASNHGFASDGQRLTLVAARQPASGTRVLPGFLGGSSSHSFHLPEAGFTGGRAAVAYWGVEEPLSLRVGQSATVFQYGSVDDSTGRSSERDLRFDRDPLAEFRPLPRIRAGENQVARVTVRVMRMDPSWTPDSAEVTLFLDFRAAMRRVAVEGK